MAITRSRGRPNSEQRDVEPIQNEATASTGSRNGPMITEKPGVILQQKSFDHIFYFFNRKNAALQRKVEDKAKIKIGEPTDLGTICQLSKFQSAIWTSGTFRTSERKDQMKQIIKMIYSFTESKKFERIALCMDYTDFPSFFELKANLREIFRNSGISITIFQNRIIEVATAEDIDEILKSYHESLLGGHVGISRMKNNVKRFYSWPTLTKDIREFVRKCPTCERTKVMRHTKTPMQIRSTSSEPFERVYIDFVGEVNPPSEKGHKYIFTATCDLTKFVVATPTYDCTAESAARSFVKHIVLKHNVPREVVSDNGPAFISELFGEITKLLRVRRIFTAPYHPQSNVVERYHRSLAQYMRAFTASQPDNWHKMLHYASFAYNNAVNSTTGHSPHSLLYGYDIKIPVKLSSDTPIYNYDSFKSELRMQLRNAQNLAREAANKLKHKNKEYYDRDSRQLNLQVNDLVMKKNENKNRKFDNPYMGPYRVTKIISPSVVVIKMGRRLVKVHVDKLIKSRADHGEATPPMITEEEQ